VGSAYELWPTASGKSFVEREEIALLKAQDHGRYLPDRAVSWIDGMPPRSLNQREPTGPDTPQTTAASSLVKPMGQ
jgi:hypothetical protein